VLHLPIPVFVLLVVTMAAGAFVGAEKVERIFQARHAPVALTPVPTRRTPRLKFALTGALALVALGSLAWRAPLRPPAPRLATAIAPLDLAQAIIRRDRTVVVLDLRSDRPDGVPAVPGALAVDPAGDPPAVGPGTSVVVYDETGTWTTVPAHWPDGPEYRYLAGGLAAWRVEVLTPAAGAGGALADRAATARQHAIAAFFSGATVAAPPAAGPAPVMPAGPGAKKKRVGGC
jgi:hypothetical protein